MSRIKSLLTRLRIDTLSSPFFEPLSKGVAFLDLVKWTNRNRKRFLLNEPGAPYESRYRLYEWLMREYIREEPVDYFEFGVADGETFQFWLNKISHPGASFYGFDTFTGLPEDWGIMQKGEFDMKGQVPVINDTRGTFYKGLFQETLFPFLQTYRSGRKKVVLLDADLYSSTLFALTTLGHYLERGDLVIFDEFFAPRHEYLAFKNFLQAFPHVQLIPLAAMNHYNFVAFRVERGSVPDE